MARALHHVRPVRPYTSRRANLPPAVRDFVSDPGSGGLPLSPAESRRFVDERQFRFLVDLEVVKAQRLQYCVSVVSLAPNPADTAVEVPMPHLVAGILRRIRATDVATQLSDGTLAVLLIDAETMALNLVVGRMRAELMAVGGSAGSTAKWSAGGACYPKTAQSPTDLLRLARELLGRALADGGDRVYIAT